MQVGLRAGPGASVATYLGGDKGILCGCVVFTGTISFAVTRDGVAGCGEYDVGW